MLSQTLLLDTGLPGIIHDFQCHKRSKLWNYVSATGRNQLFQSGEYLLGNFVYCCAPHVIGAYRVSNTIARENFNICVAKACVTNKHCIGVLKSQWYSQRELRVQLNKHEDSVRMVKWIRLLFVKLHNFFMEQNDSEVIVELGTPSTSECN